MFSICWEDKNVAIMTWNPKIINSAVIFQLKIKYTGNKNTKSNQFVNSNTHITLLMFWYFLLKNKLYNHATHKFHINDTKNHETINNNGKIGFLLLLSHVVNDHHTAVKIINSNHEIAAHTINHINIFQKTSHHDDWSGFSVKSDLMSVIFIF